MDSSELDLPKEVFEPIVSTPIELEELGTELLICFQDIGGSCEIRTCYGDIYRIVNALRDYSRLLEMVCDQWDLHGYHRASYEYHAQKVREIAQKYQAGIHYDYDAAVEKCRKKREKKQRDDDVGGDALEQLAFRSRRAAAKKPVTDAPSDPVPNEPEAVDDPWDNDTD